MFVKPISRIAKVVTFTLILHSFSKCADTEQIFLCET